MEAVKVAHLTSAHLPNDTRIFLKECRTLADAGYDVTLVAQAPADSKQGRIRIKSIRSPRTRNERMTRTVLDVYRAAVGLNADIYHFHDPELVFVGMLLKARGKRVIFDMHEDLPKQILSKEWIPGPLRFLVSAGFRGLEATYPYVFDRLVTATPAIARKFPRRTAEVVQNFPMSEEFADALDSPYSSRPPYIAYVGGIGTIRGIREIVRSFDDLNDLPQARLLLAGEFSPKSLKDEISALSGWSRVEYLGQQNRRQVSELLASSRAGLVLFHPAPNHIEAQPNKLFEYMSAGLPVIASDFPLWRELIEGERTGLLVDPRNPVAIAGAIRWILANPEEAESMGRRGRELVQSRLNWRAESRKLLDIYEQLSRR